MTTMRAILHTSYGSPALLAVGQAARPTPGPDDVQVRVRAAGVSIGDHHIVTGTPYLVRLSPFGGVPRPRNVVPGIGLSGVVEAVGARVTAFAVGDAVFGEALHGAFAESAVVPAGRLARKPEAVSFEAAAAVPWATAALQGLRDAGELAAGQSLLINGASGAVGGWAVQLARVMGAEVTAVCSARNAARVRALGAAHVIDYAREDFTAGGPRFDVVFDAVGNRSLAECRRALKPRGVFVACGGGGGDWLGPLPSLAWMMVASLFTKQRLRGIFAQPRTADLTHLMGLVEAGHIAPVIERVCTLEELPAALERVGEGHAQGQTVVRIG